MTKKYVKLKDRPLSQLNNGQVFERMLKNLDPVYLAIARERLWTACDQAIQDIENNPEKWEKSFIHPDFMRRACVEIKKHLFDEPKPKGE